MEPKKPLFIRPVEASVLIGASKSKIYQLIASGEIPSVRIGGMLRIPLVALEKLALDALAAGSEAENVR